MSRRALWVFLALELSAVFVAGAVFRIIEDRWRAGVVAGVYFTSTAAWMFGRLLKSRARWRTVTLYPLAAHLFLVSIPLLIERLAHRELEFANAKIYGIPGPLFHRVSTTVFAILIGATLLDLARAWRRATPRVGDPGR